ncbi:hypothetical protein ACHAWF_006897 [Thalassiosira exigua]
MDEDELVEIETRMRKVVKVFDTISGLWLAMQWGGTIMQFVWKDVLLLMTLAAAVEHVGDRHGDRNGIGSSFSYKRDEWPQGSLLYHLNLIVDSWKLFHPLVTFVTTFFLSEAFGFWKKFYTAARTIQGRFNDLSLWAAGAAARGENGEITKNAKEALDQIARLQRLLHQLYWSAVVKRFNALQYPEGLSYLLSLCLITDDEYESLKKVGARNLGGHHAAMTYMANHSDFHGHETRRDSQWGIVSELRGNMADIPDFYDGRMPLAYVHFVHLLVNTLLFWSPIALFPLYYYWSIPIVGLLTVFYAGIFMLSLMFLDPVDNDSKFEKFHETPGFDVGLLIRESNAGSIRFNECASVLPEIYMKTTDSPAGFPGGE